ncbi:PIG-L family deacetylase [Candidatus Woesebacteria bacterium]|nr:PIG-L family deacetylase [Candidatus Woesebacteria bacterium]
MPKKSLLRFRNILIVFPHPDDEAKSMAGTIKKFTEQGSKVTLLFFTKGERGTPDASEDVTLKKIRSAEAIKSAEILGARLIHEDFGDGILPQKKAELTKYLKTIIIQQKPDLVITYDRSGLYGHSDHITLSEIITRLHASRLATFKLWYISFPEKVLAAKKLPEHMATDKNFKKKRMSPNSKVYIGHRFLTKSRVISAYKSQFRAYERGFIIPLPNVVLWSLFPWEYFYEVGRSKGR